MLRKIARWLTSSWYDPRAIEERHEHSREVIEKSDKMTEDAREMLNQYRLYQRAIEGR